MNKSTQQWSETASASNQRVNPIARDVANVSAHGPGAASLYLVAAADDRPESVHYPSDNSNGGKLPSNSSDRVPGRVTGDAQKTLTSSATQRVNRVAKMKTGCIPCLIKRISCDPRNPYCRSAVIRRWPVDTYGSEGASMEESATSPTLLQPDLKWRRSWRERHALQFFVSFTAPQMAGFFESNFWLRDVVRASYVHPAISYVVTAIGSLHEVVLQRAFSNEEWKAQAMRFALVQCNRSISLMTRSNVAADLRSHGEADEMRQPLDTSSLLMACVLFTCFESLQGSRDSAVKHAVQARKLLLNTQTLPQALSASQTDSMDETRMLIERLELQAVSLTDKSKRDSGDMASELPPLPPIDRIHSIRQAERGLHEYLLGVMRFIQMIHPSIPKDHMAILMAEKYLHFAPWLQRWSVEFALFLRDNIAQLSHVDLKRCLVLRTNHLMGTLLAAADQSLEPNAYDGFDAQFKTIVDWCGEVLRDFPCPPVPTLNALPPTASYLSFSLWVTNPLWMTISRCRNPDIRRSAYALLSQNPRQEGIWHAGPASPTPTQGRRPEIVQRKPTAERPAPRSPMEEERSNVGSPGSVTTATTASSPASIQTEGSGSSTNERSYTFGSKEIKGAFMDLAKQVSRWAAGSHGTTTSSPVFA